MIKGKSYQMLLNHQEHKVIEVESGELVVLFEVTVLDKNKAYFKFNWQVEKYTEEGPTERLLVNHNCLSSSTSRLINLIIQLNEFCFAINKNLVGIILMKSKAKVVVVGGGVCGS